MNLIETESGSHYFVHNGRITREPSPNWDWINEPIEDEIFIFKTPLEVGRSMRLYISALDKHLITSAVVEVKTI